jgi:hypothetical protein
MKRIAREIGPPPPEVRVSKHATALPDRKPHTDDMRAMVEALPKSRVPAVFRISLPWAGETYIVHPNLLPPTKERQGDG